MPASASRRDLIEAQLMALGPPLLPPSGARRGRPEILSSALLWTGLLVCLLRGTSSQRGIWSLLSGAGLGDEPAVDITAEAVRIRIQRQGPELMQRLFRDVSAELADQFPGDSALASFARGVYALDESTLDGVARTLPWLRPIPAGDDRLLPGKLITAFDVRSQQVYTVQTTPYPRQNERVSARDLVTTLPVGSLMLADLGYFGFRWFDDLTDGGYSLLSKLRQRTSYTVVHAHLTHPQVRDCLIWLGAYRADRAKHLYRLIEVRVGRTVHRDLTNVRDPTMLSAREAKWEVILTQVWATLLLAQIVSALRAQLARRAGVDLFDVSIVLLLRELPRYAARDTPDVLGQIVARGPYGGIIRPARRRTTAVPADLPIRPPPPDLALTRTPRYAGRRGGPDRTDRRPA